LACGRPPRPREGAGPPLTTEPCAAPFGALAPGADLRRVADRVAQHLRVLPQDDGVLLACSGGPDSTALALLVAHVRPDLRISLAYVAHGLRGEHVDADDAAQVAALAALLAVEHVVLTVSVGHRGGGVESDARDVRHTALEDEADRQGMRFVAYGHHADDQAETLLLRLARGTGVDGLAGMAPVARRRLRPLLEIRRDDLRRVAEELLALHAGDALSSGREDPMNADARLARVRLRKEVLPALGRVGPDPVGALTRLAVLARDESEVLARLVDELRTSLPLVTLGRAVMLPSGPLRALPVALGRRLLRAALQDVAAEALSGPDATTVERLLDAPDGWRATLPGPLDASVERGWHVLVPAAAVPAAAAESTPISMLLDKAAGVVHVHQPSGARLTVRGEDARSLTTEFAGGSPPGIDVARLTVRLRAEVGGPLHVRTRRDGDRIRTNVGTRSLSDVLGEVGVPRALRDLLPVVTGPDDRPLWVPGVVVDLSAHLAVDPRSDTGADG